MTTKEICEYCEREICECGAKKWKKSTPSPEITLRDVARKVAIIVEVWGKPSPPGKRPEGVIVPEDSSRPFSQSVYKAFADELKTPPNPLSMFLIIAGITMAIVGLVINHQNLSAGGFLLASLTFLLGGRL